MINGSVIRDFYIQQWRNIPALVAACNDDPNNIRAAGGISRIAKSLEREVLQMPDGSVWVAYQGCVPGERRLNEITKHVIAAYIRAMTPTDDANIPFCNLMIDTVPDGQSLVVRYLESHPDADMMDMPKFERVSASQIDIDLWKLSFAVPERAG